jgi:hypothetical protein
MGLYKSQGRGKVERRESREAEDGRRARVPSVKESW